MMTASDDEISDAMRLTARLGGVFGEPAGVAGVAGLRRAIREGVISPDASALVVVTGNGLKDIHSARTAAGQELVIEPQLEAVREALERLPAPSTGGRR
jgi:threonine synthase